MIENMECYSRFLIKIRSITPDFQSKYLSIVMYIRRLAVQNQDGDSFFLFGARQTGKSTLLHTLFSDAMYYDLLDTSTLARLQRNPSVLAQEVAMLPEDSVVVIDEIPLLPQLLNEVHRIIVKRNIRFVLCGSSARKLRRQGTNTLGGRAIPLTLYPLVSAEIPDFDIFKAVRQGMIPRHYDASTLSVAWQRMAAYIGIYLKEEIKAESLVRNLSSFNRFLEAAALTDGEAVNYNNIASDCGIDAKTVREYFSILEDTLIGYTIPAYTRVVKRKVRQAPKFYFFDVSIPNFLLKRKNLEPETPDFGHAFEHLIMQELVAYMGYRQELDSLSYWHTYTDIEVDAILGDGKVAIEIKSTTEIQPRHLRGLKTFKEEHPECRLIAVSLDPNPRLMGDVEIYPAVDFLKHLWSDHIIG